MAKKTKRVQRKAPVTQVTPATASGQVQPSTIVTRPAVSTRAATAKVDLAQEYHYVFADLRKIAIIAVIMFALLFVLAFVLR